MANVVSVYKDKNGVIHILRNDELQTNTAGRILEEGKVELKEQRRRMHEMKKEEMEYENER